MFIQSLQKQYFESFDESKQNYYRNSSRYGKYLCIGDFNSETSETALRNFCDLYKLKNLVREPTCFKNPDNPSCIDLFLNKKFSRYTGN